MDWRGVNAWETDAKTHPRPGRSGDGALPVVQLSKSSLPTQDPRLEGILLRMVRLWRIGAARHLAYQVAGKPKPVLPAVDLGEAPMALEEMLHTKTLPTRGRRRNYATNTHFKVVRMWRTSNITSVMPVPSSPIPSLRHTPGMWPRPNGMTFKSPSAAPHGPGPWGAHRPPRSPAARAQPAPYCERGGAGESEHSACARNARDCSARP